MFFQRRRAERQQRADELEREGRAYAVQLLTAGATSRQHGQQVEDQITRLYAMAQKLREPPRPPQAPLTPAQERFLAARHLPPVRS